MNKEMCDLTVCTTDRNEICISRQYGMKGEEDNIYFHPEQAELLIKWIKEAADELLSKSNQE